MTPKEYMWGEALTLALLPQARRGTGGQPAPQPGAGGGGRRAAAAAARAAGQTRPRANALPRALLPLAPLALAQEGPEANVHTRWHGKSPTSIAGTVVYIVANLPGKTRVELPAICRTCGVAEGTIRQIYREIHPHLKALIDKAGGFATQADIDALPLPIETGGK